MFKQKHIKNIRIIFAIIVLTMFVYCFTTEGKFHEVVHLQFVPSLLFAAMGMVLPLVGLLLATLLFGRVYCSFLCPTGILQDVFIRIDKFFRKKKKKYHTEPPHNIVRYSLLGLTLIAWIVGFNVVVTLLDPYSLFGRIGANILHPLTTVGNNLLALIFNAFGDYTFYNISIKAMGWSSLIVAVVSLATIAALSFRKGRFYCNVICPVGTLLGLISKISLFKIRVVEERCNKCLLCATQCKAGCIDSKNATIDYSRCVACYNCLTVCKQGALRVQWAYKKSKPAPEKIDVSKRAALATGLAAIATTALASCSSKAQAATSDATDKPIMPPGAIDLKHFQALCTACHLCVSKCPSQCIKPTFLEYGIAGMLQPAMSYSVGSFCNYDCTICSFVCPNGALQRLSLDEKHNLQIGKAVFEPTRCVVYTNKTICEACSAHCPTQAVQLVPYKDGLRIPEVNVDLCLGCGECQSVCPVRLKTAIAVSGVDVQKRLYIT
ncbi:ferredoxin [Bacteroidia bacterium]|nr:ferredoxin [Bacteroidia bacterium]GHT80315.1 ferredoxin [Bacteroidia bacterium]